MSRRTTRRIAVIAGSFALMATVTITSGTTLATAAPRTSLVAGHSAGHSSVTVPIGTDNFYVSYGGGFTESGTMTLNSDGSWTLSDYGDSGNWAVVGKDIVLNDSGVGILFAPIGKHGLGSAKKPGTLTQYGDSSPALTFYTLG